MTPAGDSSELHWFKSSYSSNDGPECVEIATAPHTALVRDSKYPTGPRLTFAARAWADFVAYAGRA